MGYTGFTRYTGAVFCGKHSSSGGAVVCSRHFVRCCFVFSQLPRGGLSPLPLSPWHPCLCHFSDFAKTPTVSFEKKTRARLLAHHTCPNVFLKFLFFPDHSAFCEGLVSIRLDLDLFFFSVILLAVLQTCHTETCMGEGWCRSTVLWEPVHSWQEVLYKLYRSFCSRRSAI